MQSNTTGTKAKRQKPKTVIRRYAHVQLRRRERGKTTTIYISYTLDGTQRTENLKTVPSWNKDGIKAAIEECEAVAAQRDLEFAVGISGAQHLHVKNRSFLEFWLRVEQSKKNPKIYRNTRLKFLMFLQSLNRADITFGEIVPNFCIEWRDFLNALAEKESLSFSSAAKYLECFRSVVNEALRRELLHRNPCLALKAIPRDTVEREFLTFDELRLLMNTPMPPTLKYDASIYKAFFIFANYTGIRPSDLRNLRWANIQTSDGVNMFISFVPSKTKAKVSQVSIIPLHREAVGILTKLREMQPRATPTDKVFIGLPPATAKNTFNNFLRKWLQRAGIQKPITQYSARHGFASNLLLEGNALFEVSKLLGHTSLRHTQIYSHTTNEAKVKAIHSLPMITSEKQSPTSDCNTAMGNNINEVER